MKLSIKLMATFAVIAATLTSCGGNDGLFGDLPKICSEYKAESASLGHDIEDFAKAVELRSDYDKDMEEAAKDLSGKEIKVKDDVIKVTSPLTMTFDRYYYDPYFTVEGKAEAAVDIDRGVTYQTTELLVSLAGFDEFGKEVFRNRLGVLKGVYEDGTVWVNAGTPLEIKYSLVFNYDKAEAYSRVKELMLVVQEG